MFHALSSKKVPCHLGWQGDERGGGEVSCLKVHKEEAGGRCYKSTVSLLSWGWAQLKSLLPIGGEEQQNRRDS